MIIGSRPDWNSGVPEMVLQVRVLYTPLARVLFGVLAEFYSAF